VRDDPTADAGEGLCQIGLDVRPDGLTFVAQVRWRAEALDDPTEEAPDADGPLVAGFVSRLHGIFTDLAGQIRAVRLAERWRQESERLRQENRRLREALEGCVSACGQFLGPTLEGAAFDGCEADQARARLALDGARRLLAEEPPALPPPDEEEPWT
jgi:hypothetical protein